MSNEKFLYSYLIYRIFNTEFKLFKKNMIIKGSWTVYRQTVQRQMKFRKIAGI
jgi:predicted small secreted protein